MKNVLRNVCMSLILLSGCQVATGLSELELVREVEEPDAGPTPDLPVAGEKVKPPKAGSPAPAGMGGAGAKAEAGSDGTAGAPVSDMTVAQAGTGGGAGAAAGSGGAGSGGVGGVGGVAGAQMMTADDVCEIDNDAECNIFDNCGCEGRLTCGVVKDGEAFAIGCQNPGRTQIGNSCTGISSCVPGSLCIGNPATCKKVCETDSECGANSACLGVSNLKGVGFCAQTCVSHGDCATNCCRPSGQGVDVCAPTTACDDMTDPTPPDDNMMSSGAKNPGDTCSAASECKSNDCYKGYCYGTKRGDETCSTQYECHSGACISTEPQGAARVCLEPTACIEDKVDPCYIQLALKVCQVANKCGDKAVALSSCVSGGCSALPMDYTVAECQSLLQTLGDNPACASMP